MNSIHISLVEAQDIVVSGVIPKAKNAKNITPIPSVIFLKLKSKGQQPFFTTFLFYFLNLLSL